jgi:hypothetical protein
MRAEFITIAEVAGYPRHMQDSRAEFGCLLRGFAAKDVLTASLKPRLGF